MATRQCPISDNTSTTRKRVSPRTFRLAHLRFVLVLACTCAASVATAHADSIWLADSSSPIFGVVESSDEQSIVFKKTTDGKNFETVTFPRSNVASIVINVQPLRLESLVDGDWQSWHDYAEELIPQRKDPVARNLAMRLLVIVCGRSKNSPRRSAALKDLIVLARSEKELENLQQLLFLETGEKQPTNKNKQSPDLPTTEERQAAARVVQSVRLGRDASTQLASDKFKKTLSAFAQVCSWQELIQLSNSSRINNLQLRRLVALEYVLRNGKAVAQEKGNDSWNVLAARAATDSFSLPTIETVTEFDPAASRFVDGEWKK